MWGPPPGRYVRVDEGPVQLIKDDIPQAQADPDQWWDRQLLAVEPDTLRRAGVTTPEGAYHVGDEIGVRLDDAASSLRSALERSAPAGSFEPIDFARVRCSV